MLCPFDVRVGGWRVNPGSYQKTHGNRNEPTLQTSKNVRKGDTYGSRRDAHDHVSNKTFVASSANSSSTGSNEIFVQYCCLYYTNVLSKLVGAVPELEESEVWKSDVFRGHSEGQHDNNTNLHQNNMNTNTSTTKRKENRKVQDVSRNHISDPSRYSSSSSSSSCNEAKDFHHMKNYANSNHQMKMRLLHKARAEGLLTHVHLPNEHEKENQNHFMNSMAYNNNLHNLSSVSSMQTESALATVKEDSTHTSKSHVDDERSHGKKGSTVPSNDDDPNAEKNHSPLSQNVYIFDPPPKHMPFTLGHRWCRFSDFDRLRQNLKAALQRRAIESKGKYKYLSGNRTLPALPPKTCPLALWGLTSLFDRRRRVTPSLASGLGGEHQHVSQRTTEKLFLAQDFIETRAGLLNEFLMRLFSNRDVLEYPLTRRILFAFLGLRTTGDLYIGNDNVLAATTGPNVAKIRNHGTNIGNHGTKKIGNNGTKKIGNHDAKHANEMRTAYTRASTGRRETGQYFHNQMQKRLNSQQHRRL
eukprot:g3553.t1